MLLPYWKGELERNFRNSKAIFNTVFGSGDETKSSLLERLHRTISTYFDLGQQAYFFGLSWFHVLITVLFLSVVLYLGVAKFRGNQSIALIFGFTWLVYLYAASNFQGKIFFFHYKLPLLLAPLLLTISCLAYLDYSKILNKIIGAFLVVCIVFSGFTNIAYDYKYSISKYGEDRLINTYDLIEILHKIPENSTICDPRTKRKRSRNNQYNYLDRYITKKSVKVVYECQPGDYVVQAKSKMVLQETNLWPMFNIEKSESLQQPASLFLETPVARIYILD